MKHIFECPLAYTQLISVHGAAHMEQANHLISLKSLASIPKYKTRLHVDYSHIKRKVDYFCLFNIAYMIYVRIYTNIIILCKITKTGF